MTINRTRGFNTVLFLAFVGLATNAWASQRGVGVDGFDPFGNPQAWLTFDMGSPECPATTIDATAADTLLQPPNPNVPVWVSTAYPIAETMFSAGFRIAICQKRLAARSRL